ncbi:hypothetical protein FVR03_16820 [Pontibacter qinzhouensis]|uniref:DUF6268 domain-containing protein n=1 Tax=Pontibacter qinzhouensis TaxID=2603253 RepID=A0A5C8JJE3_9BACT|nr:DUF6268 family outer membrane beta-barrel protein [Pontibacter qinzhouensis]TXK36804.1 hypothetical protein FVR03_16820 [Pontibacter qinzhouensis]
MKVLRYCLIWSHAFLLSQFVSAQAIEPKEDKIYANPSVEGMPRGRGVVIGYERLPQFDIESRTDDQSIGNGSGRVRRNNKWDMRLMAPVLNKPQTKLIVGVTYNVEEFNFENMEPSTYSLYRYLEDRDLKSLGLQVAFLRSIDEEKFYLIRLKGELNGDYTQENINITDYLKTTIDMAYGWKKSPHFAWGVGAQFGYTFGRRRLYPGIMYNRTFNDKWGVESIFPANLRFRRNVSEKTILYAGYRLEGASYNLYVNQPPLAQFEDIELRRTDIKALLRLEQEIYDFLWFSVEGGFRQYYRNRIYDVVGSRDELINNDLAGAGYVGVELYLVPPRRFSQK